MPDNITLNADGHHEMAFTGSRGAIWHRHGQVADPSWSLDQWLTAARMNWEASKRQAYVLQSGQPVAVDGQFFVARNDNDYILSPSVTGQYQIHNVRELAETFQDYVGVDDRFRFNTMGSILGGRTVWFLAEFNGETTIGGDAHRAYLLATTAFDSSKASVASMTGTRVICQNTLRIALGDTRAMVRSTHRSAYDKVRVAKELAAMAQQVEAYKHVGDAMATVAMTATDVSNFFKAVLNIPFDAKQDDISSRKFNQFDSLRTAYRTTVDEGTPANTVWTALQAATRYVDHDRSARGGDGDMAEKRFVSAQFGSGAQFKARAWDLLLPLVKDKITVAA
jgi:phage/plasmid-like protein (TIGR03299 family)